LIIALHLSGFLSFLGLQLRNVAEPLASQRVGVVLAATGKPEVELLHVFEGNFVEQVIISFAYGLKTAFSLRPGLINPLLL